MNKEQAPLDRSRRLRLFLLIAIAAAAVICARFLTAKRRPYNLIIISIDTLRADRLGVGGYTRETSPIIDGFAKESVVFERTVSASSWTLPTHVSIFTGLYPSSHGVTSTKFRIPRETALLAEVLQRAGYRTLAFTGGGNLGRRFGFGRGFDLYLVRESYPEKELRGLEASVARAEEALREIPHDQPYFLFLHTYDVHCPYEPPEPFLSMFNSPDAQPVEGNRCGKALYGFNTGMTKENARFISDRYDGSIRWTDNSFGKLLSLLRSRGDLERSIVIVTSDHGEEFLEHGQIGHRKTLYRESLMVPLIFRVPQLRPRRVQVPVSQIDIFPTVLDLLGLDAAPNVQGSSLGPYILGDESRSLRDFQFSELSRDAKLLSRLGHSRHLIYNSKRNSALLFDIEKDPAEQEALGDQETILQDREELLEFASGLQSAASEKAGRMEKEEIDKLRTLGYL